MSQILSNWQMQEGSGREVIYWGERSYDVLKAKIYLLGHVSGVMRGLALGLFVTRI